MIKFRGQKKENSFKLVSGIAFSGSVGPESVNLDTFVCQAVSPFDPAGFTICTEFMKTCHDANYIPNTRTFILTNDSFCHLVEESQLFITNVSNALNIDEGQAIGQISEFFENKNLLVQQTGLQGYLYKVGTFVQTAGSATMVSRTVTMAKAAGVDGLTILRAQPFMIIAIPTVGAIFFHGCGSIAGNNTVGRTFNTIGNTLNLPMVFCESTYNSYVAPIINKTLGIPTVLNYTKQAMRGPGLDGEEAMKLLTDGHKNSIVKTIKCFVIKKLGGKCN